MATEITMPKLSDTMEEGTLISWKKSVGDSIKRGDIIAEVETDKANMELESFVSGTLLETRVKSGEVVPVGTVIAIVGKEGEKPEQKHAEPEKKRAQVKEPEPPEEERAEPELKPKAREEKPPALEEPEPQEEEELPPQETPEAAAEEEAVPEEEPKEKKEEPEKPEEPAAVAEKASPLVRRIAREHGISLGDIEGTGPEGRITKEDLERFLEKEKQAWPSKEEAEPSVPETKPEHLSRMRAAIAKNVTTSWRNIPHFSVSITIDMGEAEVMHRGFGMSDVAISINDMIVKAAAMALRKYPDLNASFSDEGIVRYPGINIGIAVSVEGGLLVPVVRECEKLSLKEIAARSRDLIDNARKGKISAAELSGGTFTISNLGMFGVDDFSAVIYPSQAAILAVAAITETVVMRDGRLVPARMMRVTLSADHRLVDGVDAARFLAELKKILESPYSMLV